jgi:hypothetical protein
LQEGRENANIDAGWRFIWRISDELTIQLLAVTRAEGRAGRVSLRLTFFARYVRRQSSESDG